MINGFVSRVVNRLICEKLIRIEYAEHYTYAMVTLMERIITVLSLVVIGFLFSDIWGTICYLGTFFTLRKRTGGFHAKSFLLCYVLTVSSFAFIIQVANILCNEIMLWYILLGISVMVICIVGTVNHPNMELSKEELYEATKSSRMFVLLLACISLYLNSLHNGHYLMVYMVLGISMCTVLLCLAKYLGQEVKGNENYKNETNSFKSG